MVPYFAAHYDLPPVSTPFVMRHSPASVCTAALAAYLGHPFSPFLSSELERIKNEAVYQKRVFFIRNLGFITPTEARRISFEDTVRFDKIHEETYRDFGFVINEKYGFTDRHGKIVIEPKYDGPVHSKMATRWSAWAALNPA